MRANCCQTPPCHSPPQRRQGTERAQARQAAGASDVKNQECFSKRSFEMAKPGPWGPISQGKWRLPQRMTTGSARTRCDKHGSSWASAPGCPALCAVTAGAPLSGTPSWSSAPRTRAMHPHTHQQRVLLFPLVSYAFYQILNLIKFSQWAHPGMCAHCQNVRLQATPTALLTSSPPPPPTPPSRETNDPPF